MFDDSRRRRERALQRGCLDARRSAARRDARRGPARDPRPLGVQEPPPEPRAVPEGGAQRSPPATRPPPSAAATLRGRAGAVRRAHGGASRTRPRAPTPTARAPRARGTRSCSSSPPASTRSPVCGTAPTRPSRSSRSRASRTRPTAGSRSSRRPRSSPTSTPASSTSGRRTTPTTWSRPAACSTSTGRSCTARAPASTTGDLRAPEPGRPLDPQLLRALPATAANDTKTAKIADCSGERGQAVDHRGVRVPAGAGRLAHRHDLHRGRPGRLVPQRLRDPAQPARGRPGRRGRLLEPRPGGRRGQPRRQPEHARHVGGGAAFGSGAGSADLAGACHALTLGAGAGDRCRRGWRGNGACA